jgi:hypothetical protein
MSVTSQYAFFSGFFSGPFTGFNTPGAAGQPFKETVSGTVLTVQRPDGEQVFDLGPALASDENTGKVAKKLLAAQAYLTSPIRAQGVRWFDVPYFLQDPLHHKPDDMLVRMDFDFHVPTPWYCSDADGTISLYLFLYCDAKGYLRGHVDGHATHYDGGGPFCTGKITEGLKSAIGNVTDEVNTAIADALQPVAKLRFSRLYLLPGNGTQTSGAILQNASTDAALGLVPA